MGALDFLKDIQGKVIDAATYQLLERNFQMQADNNQLLRENNELLQDRVATLQEEITQLNAQIESLRMAGPQDSGDGEFTELDGVLFKKTDGNFSDTPFCPNCKTIMSNPSRRIFICQKCEYTKKMRLPSDRCRQILKERDQAEQ
jgi:ribosomal protein S27AE